MKHSLYVLTAISLWGTVEEKGKLPSAFSPPSVFELIYYCEDLWDSLLLGYPPLHLKLRVPPVSKNGSTEDLEDYLMIVMYSLDVLLQH